MSTTLEGVSYLPMQESLEFTEPGANTKLGKDAFLKLLITQMQNQDPLNPQSNEEFIAQLSQFTQVEQLMDLSNQFDGMYLAMSSVNNTTMTQLLGKKIVAVGDQFSYSGEGGTDLHYDAMSSTVGGKLTVYDDTGSIVYSGALGALAEGEGNVTWDGKNHNGQDVPEGAYRFSITGFDSDGQTVEITEMMVGVVDGMSYETGVPLPSINDIDFTLGQILRVELKE
jgi:flagellar basal-body rod modification protein FlgD